MGELFGVVTGAALFVIAGISSVILLSAVDVIHAIALPTLAVKADAIPGRVVTFPVSSEIIGSFSGQCSELCGAMHAFMPLSMVFS